ncbi:MAG: hypothetical protein M0R17_04890 [Candidatus Omnitrophica bacterium]|jgi:dUTPase|nr:hypothetical protein [Candidatus Omnitrophota bacterium]
MFKRTIKLRIHNPLCDIRNKKFGNMTDLCINGDWTLYGPICKMNPNFGQIPLTETKLNIEFNPVLVGLGISMTLPKHYGAIIVPRSSTFGKFKCLLSNSVGVIEWNYKNEWKANLIPFEDTFIADGTSILQFEVKLLPDAPWYMKIMDLFISGFKYKKVDVLTTTREGWGSTDKINFNTQNLLCT